MYATNQGIDSRAEQDRAHRSEQPPQNHPAGRNEIADRPLHYERHEQEQTKLYGTKDVEVERAQVIDERRERAQLKCHRHRRGHRQPE